MANPIPDDEEVTRYARLALAGITREWPHKPGHVLTGPGDLRRPRELHPAFHGCFDWHSAVHGHWTLVRLLRLHPGWRAARREAEDALALHLTAENLDAEAGFLAAPARRAFERPYGWAWVLRLGQDLRAWDAEGGRAATAALRPLESLVRERLLAWLPDLPGPIRSGQHSDTAFALGLVLDHARAVGDGALEAVATGRARAWYLDDRDYPARYEPSAHDFLSPGLTVADLMRRVLPRAAFADWLGGYLPGLAAGAPAPWSRPVQVADASDGQRVHGTGLDLSRAWALRGVAAALPGDDVRRPLLEKLADRHAEVGLAGVCSGAYAGEHWLATFAVYLRTGAGGGSRAPGPAAP
jgi:hypothetical protein